MAVAMPLPDRRRLLGALLMSGLLAACGAESGPWLAFNGGGFVVNYSGGQYSAGRAGAYYGCNVKALRHLPAGTVIEARFEDPAGGPAFVDSKVVDAEQPAYAFRSPYVTGIVADHPYHVEVRVLEAGSHKLLGSYAHSFSSGIDDAWLAK
jgi:hypothetical protein